MRDLLLYVGPGTLLKPSSAVEIAYTDGSLTEATILQAASERALAHYVINGMPLVTLADLSEYVKTRGAAGSAIGSRRPGPHLFRGLQTLHKDRIHGWPDSRTAEEAANVISPTHPTLRQLVGHDGHRAHAP